MKKREKKGTNNDDRGRRGPERGTDGALGGGEAKDAGVGAVLGEERVELRKARGLGVGQDEGRLDAERHLGGLAAREECGLRLRYHASRACAGAQTHPGGRRVRKGRGKGGEKREGKKEKGGKASVLPQEQGKRTGKKEETQSAIRIAALTLFCFLVFFWFLSPFFFLCVACCQRSQAPFDCDLSLVHGTARGTRTQWAVPTAHFSLRRWRRSARSCRNVWDHSHPHT